jgi:hypothetical protein
LATDSENELKKLRFIAKDACAWIAGMLEALKTLDATTRRRLLEQTGRHCALTHAADEVAKRISTETRDEDERLKRFMTEMQLLGTWTRQSGNLHAIHFEYPCKGQCLCPLVRSGMIELNANLCDCTRGWAKASFEALLGRPMKAKVEKSLGRGDATCSILVTLAPPKRRRTP